MYTNLNFEEVKYDDFVDWRNTGLLAKQTSKLQPISLFGATVNQECVICLINDDDHSKIRVRTPKIGRVKNISNRTKARCGGESEINRTQDILRKINAGNC